MDHVAIIFKRARPEAAAFAEEVRGWLLERHIHSFCRENIDTSDVCLSYPNMELPDNTELVIVIGGDGTFLSVVRVLENRSTPIIGINLGGLGFLTEISAGSCFHELEEILKGQFVVEERMRLEVSIRRNDEDIFHHSVLNDVVINKGALARIVDLKTTIDGRYLTHYRADGLIVATPTGSTAYNLSAGGPILHPTARAIILTPICPFTLANRPIILPSDITLRVELGAPIQRLTLTCDGQVGCELAPADQIVISAAANPVRCIKTASVDYFEILRTKLKWGQS